MEAYGDDREIESGTTARRDSYVFAQRRVRRIREGYTRRSLLGTSETNTRIISPVVSTPESTPEIHSNNTRALQAHEVADYFSFSNADFYKSDCMNWLRKQKPHSIHGVVTDPPYGLVEYRSDHQIKLRGGKGGVWRIPPSFDGHQRSPLPRFTTLTEADLHNLDLFFGQWAQELLPVLAPGAHVILASNPLVSHRVSYALARAGLERRGEIARLVMTMRGGDRPKNAHEEFSDVSVMPRSMWEPWLVFRKPIEGTVAQNLRRYGTGGLRRISSEQPFGDVIRSHPTHATERKLAPHPSLKPQAFLRQVVRAVLPLGTGVVLDPFAGSGSTIAAALNIGYESIGVELDEQYFMLAQASIPALATYTTRRDRGLEREEDGSI